MMPVPADERAGAMDRLLAVLQRLLPTRWLSSLMFHIAELELPRFKNALIRSFLRFYPVDLGEAESARPEDYASFNAFFTRALKPGARPQPPDAEVLSSPVDGLLSQFGAIREGRLIQAKNNVYSAAGLLRDPALAEEFHDGSFATIYLAPHNYHRVHMPYGGRLRRWTYVPGRLFSVNPRTARALPGLFVRNERMAAVFDTAFGPLAMVMVGALFVGGVETVWAGRVTPPHRRRSAAQTHDSIGRVVLPRGAEMGRFHMGSTVILLAPKDALRWVEGLSPGASLRLGQALATVRPAMAQA
jgi:phosphatidylserine decarboxylase